MLKNFLSLKWKHMAIFLHINFKVSPVKSKVLSNCFPLFYSGNSLRMMGTNPCWVMNLGSWQLESKLRRQLAGKSLFENGAKNGNGIIYSTGALDLPRFQGQSSLNPLGSLILLFFTLNILAEQANNGHRKFVVVIITTTTTSNVGEWTLFFLSLKFLYGIILTKVTLQQIGEWNSLAHVFWVTLLNCANH